MTTRTKLAAVAAAVAFLAASAFHSAGRQPAGRVGASAKGPAAPGIAGAASCSGRGCHGSSVPEDKLIQQNEFSTWLTHDRHARAYAVLLGERGKTIARNLGIKDDAAHTDARCLACHVTPELAGANTPAELVALRSEGVSCEACHGPANAQPSWLAAHTTAAWKNNRDKATQYAEHHMTLIGDLAVQAATCAGCHVGAPADPARGIPARDCNHDIMAAGHPRLNFELGAFRVNLPPHWSPKKYDGDAGHEAKVWAVGQAATAKAALALLAYHADQARADRVPWPEFSEYDCYTCHADFGVKSWRRNPAYYQNRKPGNLPYTRWYSAMLPALAPVAGGAEKPAVAAFTDLERLMSRPRPDAAAVASRAHAAAPELDALVKATAGATYDAKTVAALLAAVRQRKDIATMRWEEIEQLGLAVAALHQAELALGGKARDPKGDELIAALFTALTHPPGYESPAWAHATGGNGEATLTRRAAVEKALGGFLTGE